MGKAFSVKQNRKGRAYYSALSGVIEIDI